MKSLIKSINTNCCYEGSAMIKNKSEKELSYDLRSKSFSIVDIENIRKNYRKHKLIERSLEEDQFNVLKNHQLGQQQKIYRQNVQSTIVSSVQRKSLLSAYCQKVSKIAQHHFSMEFNQKSKGTHENSQNRSLNHVQTTKNQMRRQKIQITCGKSNLNHTMQIRKRFSQAYFKFDGIQKINKNKQIDSSLEVEKDKRFSMQIEPTSQLYSQMPQYFIQKPSYISRESQKDLCTTIENSQSDQFVNHQSVYVKNTWSKVQKCQQVYSKVTTVNESDLRMANRQSFRQVDKENDMNMANRKNYINKDTQKVKLYNKCLAKTSDRQQKVTQSILYQQNQLPDQKINSSINSQLFQPQTDISVIRQQIDCLEKQYVRLKSQESYLLNKMQENHNEFEARYQLLLEMKAQCYVQERKRREEIDQIKKLLHQRAKQLSGNQMNF